MPAIGMQIQRRDGRTLSYAEYGHPAGRPVFFFQGLPGSRLVHPDEAITRALGARLIVVDRPGFGLSDFQPGRTLLDWPDDVMEVADRLGFPRFAVVGISGGGPYVAACAYKIPRRLTAAAIVSGMGPPETPGATGRMTRMRRAGFFVARHLSWLARPLIWLTSNPQRDPGRFLDRFSAGFPESDRVILARPEMRSMFVTSYAEATRAGVRGLAREVVIFAQPWGFRLEDIPIEVHLWHGEEDASTPLAMGRYVAGKIPNCRARFLPDEGHLLLFDRWEEILGVLVGQG